MYYSALLLAVLTTISVAARADTVALTSNRLVGNQSFAGNLGMDFDVSVPIVITKLGAFDSLQDGFGGIVQVGVFNRDTQSLVAPSVQLSGGNQPLFGSSRFLDVPDFALNPGHYSIVAVGFGSTNANGNLGAGGPGPTSDSGGGAISFVGSSRWSTATSLAFPTTPDFGSPILYDAGTFQYVTAVPEPTTSLLMAGGLGMILLLVRSRRG